MSAVTKHARPPEAASVTPALPAEQLRMVALQQETAALLDLRASRCPSDPEAERLHRRAAEHRTLAQELRRQVAQAATRAAAV